MKTIKKEVRTYRVRAICECGGEFVYNLDNAYADIFNSFFSGSKVEYENKCNKCGKVVKLSERYPQNIEEEVDVDA